MIERMILVASAALLVGGATWWFQGPALADRKRAAAFLGIADSRTSLDARVTMRSALVRFGRLVPGRILWTFTPEPLGPEDRGVAVLIALLAALLSFAMHPIWLLAVPLSPWLAQRIHRSLSAARARERRRLLERDVPSAIDVFVLALEAGLPFERALSAYTEHVHTPLVPELLITIHELEVGYRRREALDRLAARTASRNLAAFATAVRLSEDFGTPLAPALRALAIDLRSQRRQRLQETALRAPVTMLLPTAGLILLPIFGVILGPIAIRVFSGTFF